MTASTPPSEAEFLAEARAFLACSAPRRLATGGAWGQGDDEVPVLDAPDEAQERADLAQARAWRATLFDAGYAWIDGPPAHGGRGLPAGHAKAFSRLEAEFEIPRLDTMLVSLRIVVPALAAHGTPEQKRQFLPKLLRGDLVACQLFSEPEAGSDLAGVKTKAVRQGEGWVVNGQKVWTSGGHYSDFGLLLARTDPAAPKHSALTMFLVDMRSPGIDVKPLRQMTGSTNFNEVFLDDLAVPDGARVGEINEGWRVAVTTLMTERQAVGDSKEAPVSVLVDRLLALAQHEHGRSPISYPAARDSVVKAYVLSKVADLTSARFLQNAERTGAVGPEMSAVKLMRQDVLSQALDAAGVLVGPGMTADTGQWGTFAWGHAAVAAPGLRIGGGTDEIQRNILAERVLGLPREPVA
ncbi:acyl-CoA dehydrogenase family protein [Sporichthya sp.]|uniref:acyl-CoA dehydrogenase family protein n=1 Tax=Sporichthya sp. TaxID=65475 RepID=UPI001851F018|nr:acyl-CoA dehydrogenase family protein [Sporichthya sp.]MBA3741483.1 acyl-CoA dehydrogenase family protein [Sporichthya sp.]